ncbi:MAG: pyridoxal phosphate-dependent aminotransferase [Firmicutes bacterium]|nr:pyridoxal phosphate-dependent aminotransferase [Bacillota bacterium]
MALSQRARGIQPSATLAMDARAKELVRSGVDVISFGAGEPDFPTPFPAKERAITAIRENFTHYTPSAGIPELRQAVAEKLQNENGVEYSPEQIVITAGAKHALYMLFQCLLDPGDQVLVPAPYWVSYVEQVRMAGGEPVIVPARAEDGFRPRPEDLEKAVTPRTRALILNSPNNPTGAVYPRDRLEQIAAFALRHGLLVVSDEIYEHLIFGQAEHVSIASLGPEIKAHTVIINGVSKTYAMTGWRIGYAAADDTALIKAMVNWQSHSTSNATSISQWAALAALTGDQSQLGSMRAEFLQRRDYMVQRLQRIPGVRCPMPEGAFYAFPDVSQLFGRRWPGQNAYPERVIHSSRDLAELLLEVGKVAVVPGEAFGEPRCLRLSYATSMENILKGLDRMEAVIKRLVDA